MSPTLKRLAAVLPASGLLVSIALLLPAAAQTDVGVERVSRHRGTPGDEVTLTVGCGACVRHGAKTSPSSFPVSLVPIEKAPKPYRCGPNSLCAPRARAAPRRSPFTLLGGATPASDGDGSGEPGGDQRPVSRYLLRFEIPDLPPGVYTYVVFCDACAAGEAGSLIAYPSERRWRLRVHPSSPGATIGISSDERHASNPSPPAVRARPGDRDPGDRRRQAPSR